MQNYLIEGGSDDVSCNQSAYNHMVNLNNINPMTMDYVLPFEIGELLKSKVTFN